MGGYREDTAQGEVENDTSADGSHGKDFWRMSEGGGFAYVRRGLMREQL